MTWLSRCRLRRCRHNRAAAFAKGPYNTRAIIGFRSSRLLRTRSLSPEARGRVGASRHDDPHSYIARLRRRGCRRRFPAPVRPGYACAATRGHGLQRGTGRLTTQFRGHRGVTLTCRASGRATTRAAFRCRDPPTSGENLYQTDEQWAARQKQTEQGIQNALNAIGTFRGDYARRAFRQTSLIVDPPDGRTPAFTPAAEKRRAPRDRGTFGDGPFETPEDFTMYDRCITRGIVGSVLRVVYGNGNRIVQAPGMVAISYEMIHDTRVLYTDGRPHISPSIRQLLGDSRAQVGGRRTGRRDHEPHRQDEHRSERQRPAPQRQDGRSPSASSAWLATSSSTRSRSTTR